jgi:chromatin structure-remodeling complex subunit RSC1/2
MEARIKNIIKNMRKFKSSSGQLKVNHFERLPDKAVMPEYYAEVKNPIALDVIKKKLKRKKYSSIDQFMKDVELMFDNAKAYNQDDSIIFKDALDLQKETRLLAETEKKKPDSDFVMEDGRIPLPDGILHNGELWKVGDWVHIQNANDLTKPIVAQIYRTWQDQEGGKWVNACWYYRPEQTVHRFDRHFYENEVVKTGQYRDHPIDEVIDRCFVMFFTRYNRGRPRNFPSDKEIYVCESRYNEEKHKLNKIKTWASCLPDEVRDKDYEMDLFDAPKKIKKVPSPIKYLFKEDEQKETDDMPKPIWGVPNAPPKIGAVHCRPRDPKESPPPEPTPTPPPAPPPQPAREIPTPAPAHHAPNGYTANRPTDIQMPVPTTHGASHHPTPTQTQNAHPTPTFTPSHPSTYHAQSSASPVPVQHTPHPPTHHSQPQYSHHGPPLTPSTSITNRTPIAPSTHHPPAPQYPSPAHSYTQPPPSQSQQQQQQQQQHLQPRPTPGASYQAAGYQAPPPVETYRLEHYADAAIPSDVKQWFQTDEQGKVVWFTAPPGNLVEPKRGLEHSARYLAWRVRRDEEVARLRRETEIRETEKREKERDEARRKGGEARKEASVNIQELKRGALKIFEEQLTDVLVLDYKRRFGENWREAVDTELRRLQEVQVEEAKAKEEIGKV